MIDRYESPYGIICDQVELPSTSAGNLVGFPKSHHLPLRFNWVEKSIEARLDSIHVDEDKARWWYEELKKYHDLSPN